MEDPASIPAPPAAAAIPDMTPEQRYRRGKSLFDYGDCGPAVDVLAPLAVPGQLQEERAQLDVHLMLGVCYVLAGKQLEATRELSSVLSIDPDYTLDPFLTPPAALEVYDRQKAAMKLQLEEIRRVREQAKASGLGAEGGVLVERTTVIKDVPLPVAFMPFGLSQAANGENVKAIVMGGIQGVLAASTVTCFYLTLPFLGRSDAERPTTIEQATEQKNLQNGLVTAQLISAMAFTLAYGVGVADALWNHEDGAIVEKKQTRRGLTPAEIKQLKKIAPAPAPPPEPATIDAPR